MTPADLQEIEKAKKAALEVLLYNSRGPYRQLPRTAGWGYPEPYTRDLLITIFGIAVSGNDQLLQSMRLVLETLADNQSEHGHIPSLVHDPQNTGSSDSTPLFLLATGVYRKLTQEPDFLYQAVRKAMTWMDYQSPTDLVIVGQLPTSDWRDEQWVLGYGLFVNTLVYSYLKLHGQQEKAQKLKSVMNHFTITEGVMHKHVHEGLAVKYKPYYAFWSYKVYSSERFDLLGNALAILSGLASPTRAKEMISWIEDECLAMKANGDLMVDLPPSFFPYIRPSDPDWIERYASFNNPGDYHNGGIWPFIAGFYIAALVAAEKYRLAEEKLIQLTKLNQPSQKEKVDYGFNEWIKAQTGKPMGQDWQSWSAAMYLYAAKCVETNSTPYFDEIRSSD